MKIYIDESGLFIPTDKDNAFSVALSFCIKDQFRGKLSKELANLKLLNGFSINQEVKINQLSEKSVYNFIINIEKYQGIANAAVLNLSKTSSEIIIQHKIELANRIISNKEKMLFDQGKQNIETLYNYCVNLPAQLYAQFYTQIELCTRTVDVAINYYIQRDPFCIQEFNWIYDAKDTKKTDYEKFLEYVSPIIIGSNSLIRPMQILPGYDYHRFLRKYGFGEDLPEYYYENGVNITNGKGFNIGKILQESINFNDSKKYIGLQVADILASSLRRCFKNEWGKSELMATALARLFVDRGKSELPISLMMFNGTLHPDANCREILAILKRDCKGFVNDREYILSHYN